MIPALIDYGAGNLRSVANALREIGVEPVITAGPDALAGATHLILPGVGSFGDCMRQLESRALLGPIRKTAHFLRFGGRVLTASGLPCTIPPAGRKSRIGIPQILI
jgi:imidazoleglycerol phosphate synthase glutamine amidotransferase subunit HisH